MRKFVLSALAATLLLTVQLRGAIITFTEVGDAGNNIPSAQIIYGSGPLSQIVGHLNAPGDTTGAVDLFEIYVSDPANFSAFTSGGVPDPELFLFGVDGQGYEGGRDIDGANNRQGFLVGDASGTTPPLAAYLWISLQNREPACGALPMFGPGGTEHPDALGPVDDSCTLTGPIGNVSALNAGSNFAYTITLTGASFMPVPEPASVSLLALGLLAFAVGRLRR